MQKACKYFVSVPTHNMSQVFQFALQIQSQLAVVRNLYNGLSNTLVVCQVVCLMTYPRLQITTLYCAASINVSELAFKKWP